MSESHSSGSRRLPERPSLEQLRKQAKDLLHERRAAGRPATLSEVQLALARDYGFPSWPKLVHHVEAITVRGFVLRPLIRPSELSSGRRWKLLDETDVSADHVFAMFVAARDGDVAEAKRLVRYQRGLATVEYNYTPPIHFAVREGHLAITELLIEHGADLGYRSYPFSEPLLTFAEDRGHEEVAELLRRSLSRRFSVSAGTETIVAAAGKGDLRAVEQELQRDPSLARRGNETGDTALHHAASKGHISVVEALIASGADVNAVRGDGYRPIHCALMPNWFFELAMSRGERVADLLLKGGAEYTIYVAALRGDTAFVRNALARDRSLANFEDTCHHRVLSAAVRRGDVAMTRVLLEHGADPNLPEQGAPRGLSLWIAVNDGNREIVELLLARGADPNGAVDSCGTPMFQSVSRKRMEIAELLRRHGGREHRNEHAPIERLLEQGKIEEAERILRANPQLIKVDDAGWGDGILAGPAREGRHDIIALLMRLGARVPKVSKWAPYYYFKHEATAAFLLANGMDPNHMNWHRFTLLHHMAAEGELAKARLLLDHGADIDAIDDEYRSTALGVAARRGQTAMVRMLLDQGADSAAAGASWSDPLRWAELKGHQEVADVLRTSSARW